MDFNISLGIAGWALLLIGAVAFGIVVELIGENRFSYEWIATAIGGAVGAVVASEFIVSMRTFEPVWDGVALVPALVGGLIAGVVVAVVARYATGGSFLSSPVHA
jgi:uncharacterized membrane protein YeaQ/YmgE (transglycosylase-associated protein family)